MSTPTDQHADGLEHPDWEDGSQQCTLHGADLRHSEGPTAPLVSTIAPHNWMVIELIRADEVIDGEQIVYPTEAVVTITGGGETFLDADGMQAGADYMAATAERMRRDNHRSR